MRLHRFFLPATSFEGDRVRFPNAAGHQIRRVLRLNTGELVMTLDGSGMEYETVIEVSPHDVSGTIRGRRSGMAEPDIHLTVYQGLLKAAKFELVLQKCTEIGVSRFVPMRTARAVAAEPSQDRQQRFENIVREAAEQSGRGLLPAVEAPVTLIQALHDSIRSGPAVLLWEEERATTLDSLDMPRDGALALFIGPEGGFTGQEAGKAVEMGAQLATLGPRILRAETAAIAGSALLIGAGRRG